MDAPFKTEKKSEIGIEMTPGRPRKPHFTPTGKGVEELLKPDKVSGGSRMPFFNKPGSSTVDASSENAASTVIKKSTGRGEEAVVLKTGTPRLENSEKAAKAGETAGRTKTVTRFVYTENRKCIVKVDYRGYKGGSVRNTAKNTDFVTKRLAPFLKENGGTANGAQVGYIRREDAIEGDLFSCAGNTFRVYTGNEAITCFMGDPTISVILSPEDPGADLIELAKRFMKDIYSAHADAEPSFWCAAIHGNTAHKHVHIIVSTIGKNRRDEAVIRPNYVHSGNLQKDVGRLLTEIQGPRAWKEIVAADKRKKNILRLTSIDRDMLKISERQADGSKLFTLGNIAPTKKEKAKRRLQILKRYELVEASGNRDGIWTFLPGAEERLKRAEFSEYFGLTEEELNKSVLDFKYTPDYSGIILESAKVDKDTMLFMIRDDIGRLHLRKEKLKNAGDEERFTKLEDVSIQTIRDGFKLLTARKQER